MGDSMTDFIASVEAADERRDIDADFAHLREIMESRSFRTNSGLSSLITFMTIRLGKSLRLLNISSNW